jgi:hypothetical protein
MHLLGQRRAGLELLLSKTKNWVILFQPTGYFWTGLQIFLSDGVNFTTGQNGAAEPNLLICNSEVPIGVLTGAIWIGR